MWRVRISSDYQQRPMQASPESWPTSYLDKAIVRVALSRARELIAQGHSADEAAKLACPGSWSQWRNLVRAQLGEAGRDNDTQRR